MSKLHLYQNLIPISDQIVPISVQKVFALLWTMFLLFIALSNWWRLTSKEEDTNKGCNLWKKSVPSVTEPCSGSSRSLSNLTAHNVILAKVVKEQVKQSGLFIVRCRFKNKSVSRNQAWRSWCNKQTVRLDPICWTWGKIRVFRLISLEQSGVSLQAQRACSTSDSSRSSCFGTIW